MLGTIFAYIFTWIVDLITLLPKWSLPQEWLDTVSTILGYMANLDGIFPVITLIDVCLILIGFEIALFILKFTISLLNWLRGAGGINLDI